MQLRPWIERESGKKEGDRLGILRVEPVAELLGEKPRTVYAWYRLERAPSFRSALNIVIASRGEVDYNGIFEAFGQAAVAVKGSPRAMG